MKAVRLSVLLAASFFATMAWAVGFTYAKSGGKLTITGLEGGLSPTLSKLEIPSHIDGMTVVAIGEEAFRSLEWNGNLALREIVISDSVTKIGEEAFAGCVTIEKVTVGTGLDEIGEGAFENCNELKQVVFSNPNNLESIGEGAFNNCYPLESIRIGKNVSSIGDDAFGACQNLVFAVDPDNKDFAVLNGLLCNKKKTTILSGPAAKGDYVIPDGVTFISHDAFSGNGNLTSVTIPASVTKIGVKAFEEASNITNIVLKCGAGTTIYPGAFGLCDSHEWNGVVDYGRPEGLALTVTFLSTPPKYATIGDDRFSIFAADDDVDDAWLNLFPTKGIYPQQYASDWQKALSGGKWYGLKMEPGEGGEENPGSEDMPALEQRTYEYSLYKGFGLSEEFEVKHLQGGVVSCDLEESRQRQAAERREVEIRQEDRQGRPVGCADEGGNV